MFVNLKVCEVQLILSMPTLLVVINSSFAYVKPTLNIQPTIQFRFRNKSIGSSLFTCLKAAQFPLLNVRISANKLFKYLWIRFRKKRSYEVCYEVPIHNDFVLFTRHLLVWRRHMLFYQCTSLLTESIADVSTRRFGRSSAISS